MRWSFSFTIIVSCTTWWWWAFYQWQWETTRKGERAAYGRTRWGGKAVKVKIKITEPHAFTCVYFFTCIHGTYTHGIKRAGPKRKEKKFFCFGNAFCCGRPIDQWFALPSYTTWSYSDSTTTIPVAVTFPAAIAWQIKHTYSLLVFFVGPRRQFVSCKQSNGKFGYWWFSTGWRSREGEREGRWKWEGEREEGERMDIWEDVSW
jgi:hypothetical protein